MITALNMTVPLKQDPESLAKLQQLKDNFADHLQPAIDAALRKSGIVHFARVLVVHDRFLQVLTEFDGDPEEYTEFFRRELPGVFKPIFELAEGAPAWDGLNNQDAFFKSSQHMNIKALGRSTDGRESQGWLFSYFGKTVAEIEEGLSQSGAGGDTSAQSAAAAAFTAAAEAFSAAAAAFSGGGGTEGGGGEQSASPSPPPPGNA